MTMTDNENMNIMVTFHWTNIQWSFTLQLDLVLISWTHIMIRRRMHLRNRHCLNHKTWPFCPVDKERDSVDRNSGRGSLRHNGTIDTHQFPLVLIWSRRTSFCFLSFKDFFVFPLRGHYHQSSTTEDTDSFTCFLLENIPSFLRSVIVELFFCDEINWEKLPFTSSLFLLPSPADKGDEKMMDHLPEWLNKKTTSSNSFNLFAIFTVSMWNIPPLLREHRHTIPRVRIIILFWSAMVASIGCG